MYTAGSIVTSDKFIYYENNVKTWQPSVRPVKKASTAWANFYLSSTNENIS
jgi:hypothetical protein